MAITFPELEFPGTHASPQVDAAEQRAVRSSFAGVHGEFEVRLGRGGRSVSVGVIIHSESFTRESDVTKKLHEYDQGIGTHGELKIGDRTFKNCTFQGFTPAGGILPDVGNTLNRDAGAGTYYFVRGTLNFRQLSVEDD